MTLVLGVRWLARGGEEERVAELLRRLAAATREEPGCVQYEVHRDRADPRAFFLLERYADEDALRAHEATPHVRELLLGGALELLDERVRTYYEPLA